MGAVSSGGASLTSMPGRLRWIEVATASRYILGETVTRTRTSFSYLERQVTCVVPARHLGQPLLISENRSSHNLKYCFKSAPGSSAVGHAGRRLGLALRTSRARGWG